jgi:hypothetical protein
MKYFHFKQKTKTGWLALKNKISQPASQPASFFFDLFSIIILI